MLILLALLATFTTFAQNTIDDVDFSVLEPLRPVNRKLQRKQEKIKYLKKLQKEAELKSIQESGEYLAVLESGATLENIDNELETFQVHKDLNVYVHRQADHYNYKYILDKNKKIKYKVHTDFVHDISVVSNLQPKPELWSTTDNIDLLATNNKFTHVKFQFNLCSEAIMSRYLQEVAEARYDQVNRSLRLEGQGYLNWDYPVELGWSLNYQTASFETVTTSGGNYRAIHTGPIIRTLVGQLQGGDILLRLGYQHTVNANYTYRINDVSYIAVLNANTAELGTEWLNKTSLGRFSLGFVFRRQWISMKENLDDSVRLSSSSRTADAFGFTLGHDFDWKL
jgi:hypothetical protein